LDPFKDYYALLGVLPSAELVVIRAAYRALALRYHPDQWQGERPIAETRMRELNEAHEVLSNEQARSRYDALRNLNARKNGALAAKPSRQPNRGRSTASSRANRNVQKSNVAALVVGLSCLALVVMVAVGHRDGDQPSTSATTDHRGYPAAQYHEKGAAMQRGQLRLGFDKEYR
jgi:curved DNA-binding protein CbpA